MDGNNRSDDVYVEGQPAAAARLEREFGLLGSREP